jgi:hypothetical protein
MRVLYATFDEEGTFEVRVNGEVKTFDVSLLGAQWAVSLSDIANTPIAEAQRRQEFISINTQLMELSTIATSPEANDVTKRMAQLQLNYLVDLYNLPEDFGWNTLSQMMPEDEESPLSDEELAELLADEQIAEKAQAAVDEIEGVSSPELPEEVITEREEIINA